MFFKKDALLQHNKSDVISGFLVFLIALPLCLGIAKASGFPPIAGIYTAVIGGLIVTFISTSALTIKGPAAGLIAIAAASVEELGGGNHHKGYVLTLAVIVVSGLIQVLLGFVKSGKLSDFFPASIVHGMLAAIGVIIMSKQIHFAMGVVPQSKEPFELIKEIPNSMANWNPEVALIGLISILILFLHPLIKQTTIKRFPAPLIVLGVAIPLGFVFDLGQIHDYDLASLHFHIDPRQLLVALPSDFFSGITFPDFSEIFSPVSIKYIIMFALIGSIESLLSTKAIDTLDPEHRKTNMDRDLIAVGVGNTIAGFIGGLPMISEIVRSSANINNGAKSRMSNFYHGLFLFLFAFFAAVLIQKIPVAALSAMLIYTGFRLASPKEFKKAKEIGFDQLLLFLVTLVVTLLTDLLVGVAAGILVKVLIQMSHGIGFKELFGLRMIKVKDSDGERIELIGVANFINFLKFKNFLESISKKERVTVNFSKVKLVDHTFIENIYHQQLDFVQQGGNITLLGFENHHFMSKHIMAARKKMTNPYFGKDSMLTKRQLKYKNLADSYGCEFEIAVRPSVIRPYLSPFSIANKFRSSRKLVVCTYPKFNVLLSDIEFNKIGDFTKEIEIASICIINNLDVLYLPEFFLERDSMITNTSSMYGFEKFSIEGMSQYDVFGKNKEDLSTFFSKEFKEVLHKNNYSIESRRGSIMIHKDFDLLNSADLKKLMDFTNNLAKLITDKTSF